MLQFSPDMAIRRRVAAYLTTVYRGVTKQTILAGLPTSMSKWGKVRIVNGDRFRSAWAQQGRQSVRDASFVRVRVFSSVVQRQR